MEVKDLIILSDDDKNKISDLPKLFENYMTAHSEFQIRNFILNDIDFPTIEGKYHQSVRELWARYQNLINLTYEYRKIDNEIGFHELEINKILENNDNNELKKLKLDKENIEIDYKRLKLQSIKKRASEVMREMNVFIDIINVLDKKIPDEFRDETGLPNRELSEAKFWLHKQVIAEIKEQSSSIGSKTPFNKLLGLRPGQNPKLKLDELKRLVVVPEDE